MPQPVTDSYSIIEELKKLGFIPPRCMSVTIKLEGMTVPVIEVTALACPEIAPWIEHLKGSEIHVTVIDPHDLGGC